MKKMLSALLLIVTLLASCISLPSNAATITFPKIDRHPEPVSFVGFKTYAEPPKYNPNSQNPFQMDLRSADLSNLDLSQSRDDLFYAIFDSQTVWPSAGKMPADFDWRAIMETGKKI